MTKIRHLTKLLVFIASLIKLEGCLFFKEDLPWCYSELQISLEMSGETRRQAEALCHALCCSQEQHGSSSCWHLCSDRIFFSDLEKSTNVSHGLYVSRKHSCLDGADI